MIYQHRPSDVPSGWLLWHCYTWGQQMCPDVVRSEARCGGGECSCCPLLTLAGNSYDHSALTTTRAYPPALKLGFPNEWAGGLQNLVQLIRFATSTVWRRRLFTGVPCNEK